MLARPSLGRSAHRAFQRQCRAQLLQKRGLAAPASGSFQYQTGDAAGVKVASRDFAGPTTTLALVAKAGTRYQPVPGLTEALERYAFKGTERRSTLRIVREAELLGAELSAYHSREHLVLGAKFLREDLPYFVELLSEVVSKTKYLQYVYDEEIQNLIAFAHKKYLASTKEMATNSAFGLAFHRGLGTPLYPTSSHPYTKYINAEAVEDFAGAAYAKSNFALVANGVEQGELSKWTNEFFSGMENKPTSQKLEASQSKYYGGEERIAHASGNTIVLAFPGSSSATGGFYKPEIQVLASLLGGQSSIKWSSGFSLLAKSTGGIPGVSVDSKSAIFSDAGLLTVSITGSANGVAQAAQEAVKTIKSVAGGEISKDDIAKARAQAKFKELEYGQQLWAGLELTGAGLVSQGKPYQLDETAKTIDAVTEEQVKTAAKQLLENKASVSAVGDLFVLPYAEELGLSV